MTLLQAILLAAVQGISELFPISSLAHAVILPQLLGWPIDQKAPEFLPFLVLLHLGTAAALLIYFWRDWIGLVQGLLGMGPSSDRASSRRLLLLLRRAAQIPNGPDTLTPNLLARSIRDFSRASELVITAIDSIIGMCGTAGFATSHPVQRAWRDIHLASMHMSLNTETNYSHYGRVELGLERDPNQPFF